jgi:MSHA biogenesis protein MshJ
MKAQWKQWMAKLEALQPRERIMVVVAVLVVLWAMFDNLLLTPMLNKQKLYRQEIATHQADVANFQQQTQQIMQAAHIDPDAGNKQRLTQMQATLAEKDAALNAMQQDLIAPERMPRVLESLLQRDKSVKLVSLTTMPVSGLMDGAASPSVDAKATTPVADFGIYKHGFEVKLEGGYLDLMRYVSALEASPWHVLWGGMTLDATDYPKSTLTLTLYTLSLEKTWLSI